jgi:Protein of unknown function (DUF4011)
MPNAPEDTRLKGLYEDLRLRLLDLSKRNQLLNYGLSARSKRFLQIVDGTLERAHILLAGDEATMRIAPLPEPDDVPSEERTDEFRSALARGQATDVEYLTAVEAIEATGRDDEAAMEKLERGLRDRVRAELGFRVGRRARSSTESTMRVYSASTRVLTLNQRAKARTIRPCSP